MKEILFIMPSLRAGGAERVISHLANGLVKRRFKVTIALTKWREIQYSLNPEVQVYGIDTKKTGPFQQIRFIRRMVKRNQGQIIISFITMQNLYTLIASLGLKNKVIVSERNDPEKTVRNKYLKWTRDIIYLRADWIVFQTDDAKKYFTRRIQKKGIIIGNPLPENLPAPWEGIREKKLVSVARLEEQKNIPMLLDVCKNVFDKYPDYQLEIYGVGRLEEKLKDYVEDIGIGKQVIFKGYQSQIPDKIRSAAAFLLTSDYEGISNAMLEALAVGLPCICTDCPIGGAGKYIRSGENGILVPVGDVERFTDAVLQVMESEKLRNKMGKAAADIVRELSLDKILDLWVKIF